MTEAVIASYARTPIGRAYRGSLNATHGATLGAHAVAAAVKRAGLDPGEVQDVIVGASLGEGTPGANIARQVALRAGRPASAPGVTINRFGSSGLQTIALAAQRVMTGEVDLLVAGGLESISLVQNEHMNTYMAEGGMVTAGNASQLSDGAAACVVLRGDLAERRGIEPLGTFRHFVVVGCEPDGAAAS